MNLPNALSLLRILLIPVFVIFCIHKKFDKALVIFIIAGISDALDGFFARVLNQKTVIGAYLDPIADKLLLVTAFVTLSILKFIPSWVSVVVISRDIIIATGIMILFLIDTKVEMKPVLLSKLNTLFQTVTIILILYFNHDFKNYPFLNCFIWVTVAFTFLSGCQYIYKGIKIIS